MKIISLNTWGGVVFESLINFIKKQSESVDIFCFQEVFSTSSNKTETHGVRANLLQEMERVLPSFVSFYAPQTKNWDITAHVNFDLEMGLAIFIKKPLKIISSGDIFLIKNKFDRVDRRQNFPINIQYLILKDDKKKILICNFHGKARPGSKLDSHERIKTSHKINNFLKDQKYPVILCGDFNLMPETKSISILEKRMKNLIKEYNIKETRGRINSQKYKDAQHFADYIFVSSDLKIEEFTVPDVEISDHLPMILKFS